MSKSGEYISVPMRSVTRDLTHSEILNLVSNPVEIVPAPGEGKFIRLISAFCILNSSVAYSGIDNSSMYYLIYGDSAAASNYVTSKNLFDQVGKTNGFLNPFTYYNGEQILGQNMSSVNIDNKPLNFIAENVIDGENTNFTGGNANNKLRVIVFYFVISL